MGREISERWILVRDTCDANPGQWVHFTDHGHGSWPNQIKHARLAAFKPAGAYEGMMRKGNGLVGEIYARKIV